MELPENAPEYLKRCPFFQTYDLGKGMNEYILSEDRELLLNVKHSMIYGMLKEVFGAPENPIPTKIFHKRKKIIMSATNCRGGGPRNGKYVYYTDDGSDIVDINYVVQIRDGKVSSIKEESRNVKPALPLNERN